MEKESSAELMRIRREIEVGNDEISLIDLWLVLARHKRTIMIVFAVSVLVGSIIALLTPKQYAYSTTIEIAQTFAGGERRLIESIETVQAKLTEIYIPSVLDEAKTTNIGYVGDVDVRVPTGSDVLLLTSLGQVGSAGDIKKMHLSIVGRLANNHKPLVDTIMATFKQDRTLVKNQIDEIREVTSGLKQQEAALLMASERLKSDIDSLHAHLAEVETVNKRIISESKAENLAMNILMTNREYDIKEKRLRSLEQRLYVTIPAELERNKGEVAEKQRSWRGYQISLRAIDAKINNLKNSGAISLATKAVNPSGIGKRIIVILSAMLGLFCGIFAAFIHEFICRANEALNDSR